MFRPAFACSIPKTHDKIGLTTLSSTPPDLFRTVCGRFATGVAVAACLDASGIPHGLTVNSFTSVSLEPPLVLVCLDHKVQSLAAFQSAPGFSINILRADQQDLSRRFSSVVEDRFENLDWTRGEHTGSPLFSAALATLECRREQVIPAGDHSIFLGRVVHARCTDGEPLLYFAGRYSWLAPR